jgi:ATP-binding protein involved in chromosome partitioning
MMGNECHYVCADDAHGTPTINILLSYPAQSYHQTLTDAITSALSAANIKDVTVNIETKIAKYSTQKG